MKLARILTPLALTAALLVAPAALEAPSAAADAATNRTITNQGATAFTVIFMDGKFIRLAPGKTAGQVKRIRVVHFDRSPGCAKASSNGGAWRQVPLSWVPSYGTNRAKEMAC